MNDIKIWQNNAEKALAGVPRESAIRKTFFAALNFIMNSNWQGGCHAVSAVMYVLYKEQDIDCQLCLGELKSKLMFFDHSWIEIDGLIYDAAIVKTLLNTRACSH
ncbi:hypothetical protein HOD41_02940 [bacterium]|jgi:hypothetical protein|nr:hypothetical protein [bacterium]